MKKLTLLLLALTAFLTAKSQQVFHSQPSNNDDESILPSSYSNWEDWGAYQADDFTLTENQTQISEITVFGLQDYIFSVYFQGLDVYIFNNANNIPDGLPTPENPQSNALYAFTDLNNGSDYAITSLGGDLYDFTIDLTSANNGNDVILDAGTYWVSVVPRFSYSGASITSTYPVIFWRWFGSSNQNDGYDAVFVDPTNHFEQGLTDWVPVYSVNSDLSSTLAMVISGDNVSSVSSAVKELISIYPSPSSDFLNINLPKGISVSKVEVFDAQGKTQQASMNNNTLDIQSLATGVHFLRIQTNSGIITKKFVKK
ncbi:T9SS type A sorting domain-containing protein [Phaeodactylibacter luteus]|uniref:T9SS type A sorting domain-containing protein n=1 Tax=Phaeodactylibacter luteus TaxID=1564516 RepID=A0A5C6RMP7_9BACT|nr:T9SS type A sorting domain-containing protein [Phaeodactylibacter luteus]TXB63483.1 T9SS type A sorting domain-containing protein [Phaeodactylibacter luteus]